MTSMYDVLKASKGVPVNDIFAELWGRKLSGGYTIVTYTGILPATLTGTKAGYLHKYKVYGNTVQDGTPTPENPIMPSGCGERTENVMPSAPAETKTNNGIAVTCDGNGVYTLSGTALSGTYIVFRFKDFTIPISVGQGGQGTMSLFNTVPNGQVFLTFMNNGTEIDTWFMYEANRKNNEYSAMSGKICNAIQFYVPNGNNCDCVIKPCFTNDSIYPANYIPYGYKLPILSNSAVTNIYLGEVETTRMIKKLVLTGEENWYINNPGTERTYFNIATGASVSARATQVCTHYQYNVITSTNEETGVYMTQTGVVRVRENDPLQSQLSDFKSFLAAQYAAGTPVTIWYVLAEPETAVVNAPLMKIGDYADAIDSTQTSVQIPTAAGETTISWAGEGLAPSEVEFEYEK